MERTKKPDNKFPIILGVAAVAVIGIIIAIVVIINANRSKLLGKWIYEYGSWGYDFQTDTRGEYSVGEYSQGFTYKDNGNSLTIKYDGSDAEMTLDYRIEDNGKKLVVADSIGRDTIYNRQ